MENGLNTIYPRPIDGARLLRQDNMTKGDVYGPVTLYRFRSVLISFSILWGKENKRLILPNNIRTLRKRYSVNGVFIQKSKALRLYLLISAVLALCLSGIWLVLVKGFSVYEKVGIWSNITISVYESLVKGGWQKSQGGEAVLHGASLIRVCLFENVSKHII